MKGTWEYGKEDIATESALNINEIYPTLQKYATVKKCTEIKFLILKIF